MEELKTVKQVFRDYNSNSFALSEAKVVCVNIYKKTNILEIKLKNFHLKLDVNAYLMQLLRFTLKKFLM